MEEATGELATVGWACWIIVIMDRRAYAGKRTEGEECLYASKRIERDLDPIYVPPVVRLCPCVCFAVSDVLCPLCPFQAPWLLGVQPCLHTFRGCNPASFCNTLNPYGRY